MKTVNGALLKKMFFSAANNLFNHYPEVDSLNVFPVPDGDTGTNMNLTITSGVNLISNLPEESVGVIAKEFSKGLLMGARGNSGVITSQIFRGFALSLENKKEISINDFKDAMNYSKDIAYRAVMRPVEGTILTIIREVSEALQEETHSFPSFEKLFAFIVKEAHESLLRTPNLLPVLREVGVVDSGAAGLCYLFEGMEQALLGRPVKKNENEVTYIPSKADQLFAGASLENEEFGYCTEFILELNNDTTDNRLFNEKRFNNVLNMHGNSLVMVRDENIVKVHLHTLHPGSVLTYAEKFGEFVTLKIENMKRQHQNLKDGAEPEKTELLQVDKFAIIAVSTGEGVENLFKEYGVKYVIKGGQTMNPSTEDFVAMIKASHAENVFLFPNNSNIILAAEQAKELTKDVANVYVVPTKTIPQGLTAAISFSDMISAEENFEEMSEAIKNVKSGSVTKAIRNTTFNGLTVKEGQFIAISDKNILAANDDLQVVTLELIASMIDDDASICTILVGEEVAETITSKLMKLLEKKYPLIQFDLKPGGQPLYPFVIGVE